MAAAAAAAAAWDVLSKAANLAQMLAMLVAVFTFLLRVQHSNRRELAELERCARRLHALLQWQLCSEMVIVGPVVNALGDAARLIDSYKKSTLWRRVRGGGSTATQLRDMQDVVNSYCGLLLFVNAQLLLQQQATHHDHPVPASSDTDTSSTTIHQATDTSSQSQSYPGGTGAQRTNNDIDQGGIDTDIAGCETDMPSLLPIVISHA